jgi:Spy/CpxP family protein refolding chaperone
MLKVTTLLLAGTMAIWAQGPGMGRMGGGMGGAMPVDAVKAYLALTDDQVAQLQELQKEEMTAEQPLREQMMTKQESLRKLIDDGSTDAAAIAALQADIKALQTQLSDSRAKYRDQAKAILTGSQATKLTALEEAAKLMPAIAQAGGLNLLEQRGGMGMGIQGGPGGMMPMRRPATRSR